MSVGLARRLLSPGSPWVRDTCSPCALLRGGRAAGAGDRDKMTSQGLSCGCRVGGLLSDHQAVVSLSLGRREVSVGR